MNINRYIKFVKSVMKSSRYCHYLLLLFLFSIMCQTTYSQVCDPEIAQVEDAEFGYRARGNRCEGFYPYRPVGKDCEIVSVLQGRFHFRLEKEEVLSISSPVIIDHLIYVRAIGVPPKSGYRMDAQLEPGQTLSWPVRDVLYPGKISDKEVGLFGWIGEEPGETYIPVAVTTTMDSVENDGKIRLYLRTSNEVEMVKWRFSDEDASGCSGLNEREWKETRTFPPRPWKPIEILLPSSKTGILCGEIAVKSRWGTGKWGKKHIRVIVGTETLKSQ